MPTEERFWSKVKKAPGDGCWEWTGSGPDTGYGNIHVGGRNELTHRYSWALANGEIPRGLCVLHRCDNRKCVRPSHLFLGSKKDNTRDMFFKGRERNLGILKGQDHGGAKLTTEDVLRIREAAARGATHVSQAAEYGVDASLIGLIVRRKAWRHI